MAATPMRPEQAQNPTPEQLLRNLETEVGELTERAIADAKKLKLPREDAEDAVQEMFLASVKMVRDGNAPAVNNRTAWSLRVARNRGIDAIRDRARRQHVPLADVFPSPKDLAPEAVLIRDERKKVLQSAISSLPKPYKEVIILSYLEGLSKAELVEYLRIKPSAVHGLLHRARKKLTERLSMQSD